MGCEHDQGQGARGGADEAGGYGVFQPRLIFVCDRGGVQSIHEACIGVGCGDWWRVSGVLGISPTRGDVTKRLEGLSASSK